jgi:hypothetical protein
MMQVSPNMLCPEILRHPNIFEMGKFRMLDQYLVRKVPVFKAGSKGLDTVDSSGTLRAWSYSEAGNSASAYIENGTSQSSEAIIIVFDYAWLELDRGGTNSIHEGQ